MQEAEEVKLATGDFVHYKPEYGDPENGRIKSINRAVVFVVYKCNDEWEKYREYTAQGTDIEWVGAGWVDKNGNQIETPKA